MSRIKNLKKLTEEFNKCDCSIYDFCYYLGINNVIDYDEEIKDIDVDKVVEICDYVCGDREDPIEVGQDLAYSIFVDKKLTLVQLRELPSSSLADAYNKDNFNSLNIEKEHEIEIEKE